MSTMTALSELSGDYVLDTTRTRIGFVARHRMATRVRGQFDKFEGSAHLDGNDPSKSSARLSVQANSIQTRSKRRDEQLSDMFLNAGDHPTITFTSTGVNQASETTFEIAGDLTIRGVTRPIMVGFELAGAENDRRGYLHVIFRGRAAISRSDWGVNWNTSTSLLVDRRVTLEFDVAAIWQS